MREIILLCGPDGSGKTTIARLLNIYFESRGIRSSVSWIRGSHTIVSVLARILKKFDTFKGTDNPYYNITIPPKMRSLWIFLEFISIIPLIVTRFVFKSFLLIVVGERSPLDFIVWIISTTRTPRFVSTFYGRFMLALTIKWKTIFLYAPIDVLCSRRQSECRFIKRTMPAYIVFSKYLNMPIIETSENDCKVFRKVLETI
jgi:energy-coupling factor transporter ATP-binding protein EcfA2